jgi:hypothetical protein
MSIGGQGVLCRAIEIASPFSSNAHCMETAMACLLRKSGATKNAAGLTVLHKTVAEVP